MLPAIKQFRAMKLHEEGPFGLRASFNLTFQQLDDARGWRSPWHMVEN